jgi:hypothetical protein
MQQKLLSSLLALALAMTGAASANAQSYGPAPTASYPIIPAQAAPQPAPVQEAPAPADVRAVLSGDAFPLTLRLKDMDGSGWRQFRVGAVDQGLSSLGAYMSVLSGGQNMGGQYFTNSQTVVLGDATYLVAYRLPSKPIDYSVILGQQRADTSALPDPISPNTQVTLTLLNLSAIGALDAIQTFDMANLIRSSNDQRARLAAALGQSSDLAAQNNLQQLTAALLQETQDANGTIPPIGTPLLIRRALQRDIRDETVFMDPLTHRPFFANPFLTGHKITEYVDPSTIVLLYSDSPGQDGLRAVAFLDGDVRMVGQDEWNDLAVKQRLP